MTRETRWWEAVFSAEDRAIYDAYRRKRDPSFPWRSSALIVIDATQAFLGPKLPTRQACRETPAACGLPGWQAVPHMAALLREYRAARLPVLYTTQDRSKEASLGGATAGAVRNLAADADDIIPALRPMPDELVVRKPKASGFFATGLAAYCIKNRIAGAVLAGGTTSGCVRATAVDACAYGLDVVIASDGCFDRSQLSAAVALFELDAKYGRVLTCAQLIDELGTAGAVRA
jgi:nicotinamidase-related amidase